MQLPKCLCYRAKLSHTSAHFTLCTPCARDCCISSRFIFPLKYLHLTTLSNSHNHLNFFNLIGLRHCALRSCRLFVVIDITCRAKTTQSAMWSIDRQNTGCQPFTTIGRSQPPVFISSPAGGIIGRIRNEHVWQVIQVKQKIIISRDICRLCAGQWVQAITICAYIQSTHKHSNTDSHTQTAREDSRKQYKQTQLCLACVRQDVGACVHCIA